ncbi:MAG: Zn-dependent alcohol dehydrogenase [Thermomicrobiales bacterium]|nr:Zn-dependent alcohol dehydrogenase [Thermomicrobiales bacterium]
MRAAVQFQVPGALEIVDLDVADPGPREVLIQVAASGLCHSDLHFLEGKYHTDLPCVLGHEASGVVVEVGRDVTYLKPGDHVITCLSSFCGTCSYCVTGRPYLCNRQGLERGPGEAPRLSFDGQKVNQFARLGAFAEQMLVHENSTVVVREDMPLDRAALVGCAVTTGVGAVVNTARIPLGATVAILGCGGVGLNAVQGAALAGAGKVIAIDKVAWKLELARTYGATDVVDASEEDAVEAVRSLVPGGVDFAFEAIGLKSAAEQAFQMLAKGGSAVIVGMIPEGQMIEINGELLMGDGKSLLGSNMGSNRFRVDVPKYVDAYLAGTLKLDELVSRRITLDDVNDGYAALNRGEVARSVIVFDETL